MNPRPRFALARAKARELLERAGVKHPPVPVERLAREERAVVRYEPFDGDLAGMIHHGKRGHAVIGVNSLHPVTRQRFTIAHELGHLVLHRSEVLHVDPRFPMDLHRDQRSTEAVDSREIEANQFAAELLMPEAFLSADLEGHHVDVESDEELIGDLARRYGVSPHALTIRLTRFGRA